MDELNKWYQKPITYSEADAILQENFSGIKRSFVAVGYYLKRIRDDELFRDGGYESVWDYAEDRFGIKRTTASRWMSINDKFSEDGNSPNLSERYADFGKGQLQEMLYLEEEQLDKITPDMTVKEIREVRKPEPEPEEEPVSVLGYPLRVYPEDSLIATPGCGKQDCFSCHRDGCEIRQVDCYCVEAPMGNPFPCTTLNVVDSLRQDIGNRCQFVNSDLADERAGDGQPVPCCKRCNNPCGYECNRSVQARNKAKKAQQEEMCDVAHDEVIEENHGTSIDELDFSVRTYNALKRSGVETIEELQSMSDVDLVKIRNFSKRCMDEVHSKLEEYTRNNSEKPVCDIAHESLEDDALPEKVHDEAWFVGEYAKRFRAGLYEIMKIFREYETDADRAKEIQKHFAPYGYHSRGNNEFSFTMHGFKGGIEFEAGNEKVQMKYGRFVKELEKLYDPYSKEFLLECDNDIDSNINNVVEEQPISATELVENSTNETVIDAEYQEVVEDNLDELTFSRIAIRDYLEEEEGILSEYERVNSEDGGLPRNLMIRQMMLVKALRLLLEYESKQDEQEEADEQEAIDPVQPELPVLKNSDQRKEWLNNYKEWGLWYRDENIDVNYYKYDFSDGSRLVVAEYPQRRTYWKPNKFEDEHHYHLLEKNRKYYGSNKTFQHQFVHSTDSETYLVEFLNNLQKGEKK